MNQKSTTPGCPSIDTEGNLQLEARTIPAPAHWSPQARQVYIKNMAERIKFLDVSQPASLVEFYTNLLPVTQEQVQRQNRRIVDRYPVTTEEQTIGGVKVSIVTPSAIAENNRDRVLINLHGGGFMFYAGSIYEAVPVAYLGKIRVVAVDYRMPPQNPFPAALEDASSVYLELLDTYRPQNIGIFGTSAGAALTATTALHIRDIGLAEPGALSLVSYGTGDSVHTLDGLDPYLSLFGRPNPMEFNQMVRFYAGNHEPLDPLISPHQGDFTRGFPPSQLIAGTRDLFLSGTPLLHRKLRDANIDAELEVFDGMWHGFNADMNTEIDIPEAEQASKLIAEFFNRKLGVR